MGLYGRRAESGKMAGVQEDILKVKKNKFYLKQPDFWPKIYAVTLNSYLMCDNCNPGVVQVEPGRYLAISDDEDVSHPGGVSLN